jgi:predicted ArsR family transcriptional regulator
MTQPHTGGIVRPRGNPAKRQRGETVRAVLIATLKPNKPVPLDTLCDVLRVQRTAVLNHLAALQTQGRIGRYTTANGMVRVW